VATLYDYFQRACRTPRNTAGLPGERCFDDDGNSALFWIAASEDGRIEAVAYRCTTCFTLVGLCEHLAELAAGTTLRDPSGWTAERLLSLHPEIPGSRRDRAALAVAALQSAARQWQGVRV
jgi:hypothetical protein